MSYDDTNDSNFAKFQQAFLKLAHKARYHLKVLSSGVRQEK